jgi:hypothetical protein
MRLSCIKRVMGFVILNNRSPELRRSKSSERPILIPIIMLLLWRIQDPSWYRQGRSTRKYNVQYPIFPFVRQLFHLRVVWRTVVEGNSSLQLVLIMRLPSREPIFFDLARPLTLRTTIQRTERPSDLRSKALSNYRSDNRKREE